jgi:hypothetical protein
MVDLKIAVSALLSWPNPAVLNKNSPRIRKQREYFINSIISSNLVFIYS